MNVLIIKKTLLIALVVFISRVLSRLYYGPMIHLYSFPADLIILFVCYLAARFYKNQDNPPPQ